MGGGYELALAVGHGYAAASTSYGACPEDAERILAAVGIDHDVKIYPGVGHGFINDYDPPT
jgi:carboxymethylenebutenolidase